MATSFIPKSEIGQHVLLDQEIIHRLCRLIPAGASCVEIGPGSGNITRELLAQGNRVVAFEIDTDCRPILDKLAEAQNGALIVHWGNFLDVPAEQLNSISDEWYLVGNIPYNISEPLLHKMADLQFNAAALLVGSKLAAAITRQTPEGGWSRMSLLSQAYFNVEKITEVPPEAFDPPPRARSALIHVQRKDKADPNWKKDAVACAYRALVEADVHHSTAAKALKTICVDEHGVAQEHTGLVADKSLATMRKLVASRVDERILSRPLTHISNDELRKLCAAICAVVSERQTP
jgi:16S rRNA (adenine1518-N6/adenine1519-N6)-dimethyltransferase